MSDPGHGTLHGVGIGPGDPDLLTLRAARLISGAAAVAVPGRAGGPSLARQIAGHLIPATAEQIDMPIPMERGRGPAQAAYDRAAARIAAVLETGRDVVVLCEGDPMLYGSFMYLHARLAGRFRTETVPGVSSVTACAALAGRPLASRDERLTILPATLPGAELLAGLRGAEALVIMKLGRHLSRVRALIEAEGLGPRCVYVARAGQAGQQVLPLAEAPDPAPYFSMLLLRKGGDPWLE